MECNYDFERCWVDGEVIAFPLSKVWILKSSGMDKLLKLIQHTIDVKVYHNRL